MRVEYSCSSGRQIFWKPTKIRLFNGEFSTLLFLTVRPCLHTRRTRCRSRRHYPFFAPVYARDYVFIHRWLRPSVQSLARYRTADGSGYETTAQPLQSSWPFRSSGRTRNLGVLVRTTPCLAPLSLCSTISTLHWVRLSCRLRQCDCVPGGVVGVQRARARNGHWCSNVIITESI